MKKVIGRFVRWIQMEASQLNAKFFEKQFKLILNLAESYWFKIKKIKWTNLQITLEENN